MSIGSAAATLLGIAATLLTFLPRVAVVSSPPIEPKNALTSTFTITNTSFIPLRDVSVSVGLGLLSMGGKPSEDRPRDRALPRGAMVTRPHWQHHKLPMDQSLDILLSDAFRPHPDSRNYYEGDIDIVVSYRPWISPFSATKAFTFVTRHRPNGDIQWYAQPSPD